jgi:Protein of unknown function (DUF1549)/Protein of unknown function (DUF1553)
VRSLQALLLSACSCLVLSVLLPTVASAAESRASEKVPTKSASPPSLATILAASHKVDQLIEAGYKKHDCKPNPRTSDQVFVRRIYLDLIGRIPTYQEARSFLDSRDPNKRSKLIDRLLASEGYVSHQFNYWADLLRLQSRMRYAPAKPYLEFVKKSVRQNKPYDQFVRELLTAEGYTWDKGAAGYYIRDTGMPLDNMSNTIQVFLGTQLVCAQCHNHPFDSWTQMQYYKLAAFTYGIETRDRRNDKFLELRKMRQNSDMDREVYRSANRILRPLAYRVHETERPLRLPKDYAYQDAKPLATVDPDTLFGEKVKVGSGESRKEVYAKWMTSPKNPRFATVIANRLWKRAMGIGLIEPVDDLGSRTKASNPELMKYLSELMVELKYDLKQYQRVLYNSKTYQREVSVEEVAEDEAYSFPGPALRRLSAEQLWDSLMALIIADVDERQGVDRGYQRYTDGEPLVGMSMKEIMKMARSEAESRTAQVKFREKTAALQKEYRIALRVEDRAKANQLREKMDAIRREIFGSQGNQRNRLRPTRPAREADPRWVGFSQDLVRASEVESPARPGHFLRQFGQSDRETIENASTEATVPQILTLLNGPIYGQLTNRNSVLTKNLARARDAEQVLDVLYLSILARPASEREAKIALPRIQKDRARGIADVVWALLNTQEFMFAQ